MLSNRILVGVATVIGIAGLLAALLIPFLGDLADTLTPLGVPAEVWQVGGVALAAIAALGRWAQDATGRSAYVPVGLATRLAVTGTFILTVLVPGAHALLDIATPLGLDPELSATLGIGLAAVTQVGRIASAIGRGGKEIQS